MESKQSAVVKNPCLQDSHDEVVDEKVLQDIAPEIASERKKVARNLGFKAHEIDIIEADHDGAGKGGITETAYQMLIKWKSSKGGQATIGTLSNALEKAGLKNVAEKVKSNIR
ncbi:receptor-interacting serine/threonine-protein kinase 1-like isoform X2 [Apostichopus japonicus]